MRLTQLPKIQTDKNKQKLIQKYICYCTRKNLAAGASPKQFKDNYCANVIEEQRTYVCNLRVLLMQGKEENDGFKMATDVKELSQKRKVGIKLG